MSPHIENTVGHSRSLLVELATEVLQAPVEPDSTLIALGLDSLSAADLHELLEKRGYELDFELLLSDASVNLLAASMRKKTAEIEALGSQQPTMGPIPCTEAQAIWVHLDSKGWGSWANISLCLSIPATLLPAAYLPAIAQSLCDANEAMRMVLVETPEHGVRQMVAPEFQLSVTMDKAPALERDAMRLIETFEGEEVSPFEHTTRALVLESGQSDGRHWLCISMHHVFADRVSMQSLDRQIRKMIAQKAFFPSKERNLDYTGYALWRARIAGPNKTDLARKQLHDLIDRVVPAAGRQSLKLIAREPLDLGDIPTFSELSTNEFEGIEALSVRLETTAPLLLHALFSVVAARLVGDEPATGEGAKVLLCHVVSNREDHSELKDIVGCFDTSVPVAVSLGPCESLQTLCKRTRRAFAEAYRPAINLPRGEWTLGETPNSEADPWVKLVENTPHINIIRLPRNRQTSPDRTGIREHQVRRMQKTRWGLLLRVTLPASGEAPPEGVMSINSDPAAMRISVFAEHQPLACAAHYCFSQLLRDLLTETPEQAGETPILEKVDHVVEHALFASSQLRRATSLVSRGEGGEAFIFDKLVARQKRWYEHDGRMELRRDDQNRFVGTPKNPFPFTQLDKLRERDFLDKLGVPLPRLLHVVQKKDINSQLPKLIKTLPGSFAIKPVGAGHSFGVTLVRDGKDLTQNEAPFDARRISAELSEMAERGYCVHRGQAFPFNFSSILIEELVEDERGYPAPTDYKFFMIGEKLLWLQLHFSEGGHNWVAFVNAAFQLLPQPAWNPTLCWRTHRALVCTEQSMASARKPDCLSEMLEQSRRLAKNMGIFVRLDWYADKARGPLMGEVTTFPHMLQPRSFYTSWANSVVKAAWQDPDGVRRQELTPPVVDERHLLIGAERLLENERGDTVGLEDFLPSSSRGVWAFDENLSFTELREYIAEFDLSPWGVAGGERVAILIANGVQLGGLLLSIMNRYVAVPIGQDLPASQIAAQMRESKASSLVVIAGTDEARKARDVTRSLPALVIVELNQNTMKGLAQLPSKTEPMTGRGRTPKRKLDDEVLVLRTSGSTGDPKRVGFHLASLMRSGLLIGQSLSLSPTDIGASMLPLHHIGGIASNLIAPLLAGSSMRFFNAFDPRLFFDALAGEKGATWCYLVPSMWDMVLEYAMAHPELHLSKPWPQLKAIRSAGSDLPHQDALKLADLFGEKVSILPTYGMTEAMPIAAPQLPYRLERPGSVGRVLPTVLVEIVNPSAEGDMEALPDGLVGEVTVKGPAVLRRYDQDELDDARHFTPRGFFRTGDLGSLSQDGSGWLSISGRIKDVINRGGETIAPVDIEAVLRNYPGWPMEDGQIQLMAFARSHEVLGEDVALAAAPISSGIDLAALNDWASDLLSASMLPKTLVHLPELPRSAVGKLQRTRIAKEMGSMLPVAELGNLQTFVFENHDPAPRLLRQTSEPLPGDQLGSVATGASLASVVAFVQEFAGEDVEISPDSRLDEVGINSLAAVELSKGLNDRFGGDLPSWIISDYPTPRALFSQIAGSLGDSEVTAPAEYLESGASSSEQTNARPLRLLFLHGEGADANLMETGFLATHWIGKLGSEVEFVFMDAPHLCSPKPEFHHAAVANGLYNQENYRSWGVTNEASLASSLSAVRSKLDEVQSIDAIGGICDGGLVAALVASERTDLRLYLNISSSPVARLPIGAAKASWMISCPTIHLLSLQDELNSWEQQLEVPQRCKRALLLQHDHGHAVPTLNNWLLEEFQRAVFGETRQSGQIRMPAMFSTDAALSEEALAKVEATLLKHECVEAAVAAKVVVPPSGRQRDVGFVVLDQYALNGAVDLRRFLEARLPDSKLPDAIVPIEFIPTTSDGSIDYNSLAVITPTTRTHYAAPRTQLERELAKVWQDVLMLDWEPGIDDDFFELGGYSLLSMSLLMETERRLEISVPNEAILELSSIRRFVELIEHSVVTEIKPALPPVSPNNAQEEPQPLSDRVVKGLLAHTAAWKGERCSPDSLVFGLNADTTTQPIFWCCQGFREFSQLAKHLGPNQPVFGMRSGHLVMDSTQPNIESLARQYAAEISSIQKEGSLVVGGNCASAKIAFQIAQELQRGGRYVSLLFLQEQVVPLKYSGKVALLLGKESTFNPARYFKDPSASWLSFYDGDLSVTTISGKHGQFFSEPNIQSLAAAIRSEMLSIRSGDWPHADQIAPAPIVPVLPAPARKARIDVEKFIFLHEGAKEFSVDAKITNISSFTWPGGLAGGIIPGYWIYTQGVKVPVYYGLGERISKDIEPGESVSVSIKIDPPSSPGAYRIDIDLADNGASWFQYNNSQVGSIVLLVRKNRFGLPLKKWSIF